MATRFLRGLMLGMGVTLAGVCTAGGDGIYQRDGSSGAVELSNLPGEDDGQLVVAPSAAGSAVATTAPGASGRVAAPRPSVQRAAVRDKVRDKVGDKAREAETDSEAAEVARLADGESGSGESRPGEGRQGESRQEPVAAADGSAAAVPRNAASGQDPNPTMAGAAPSYGAPAAPAVPVVPATNEVVPAAVATGADGAGPSGAVPPVAAVSTPAAVTAPSVLDSPSALAARLSQYRDLMLNQPLAANGQPPNPAVVRRYLMTNRAAYTAGK